MKVQILKPFFQRLLAVLALLLFSASQAANFNLTFTGGTAGAAGGGGACALTLNSQCRYNNVVVGAGAGIYQRDAIVTISKLTNSSAPSIYDNEAVQLDAAGAAHAEYFAPTINSNTAVNTTSWTEYTFQFVTPGTQTASALTGSFYMTSYDTDGDGQTLREFIEFLSPTGSGLSNASNDQVGTAVDGGTQYIAIASTNQPAIGSGATYRASALYANTSSFKFAVGAVIGATAPGAANARLSAYAFASTDSVYLSPSVDGYKSVRLTTDADGNGAITPGDTLTYTITYTNTGSAAETGFQITDTLPAGVTAAAGAQTVRLNGTVTAGARNTAFTGAGANTGLLAANQTLPVGGTVSVDIPVTVSAVAADNTTLSNQTSSSGNYTNAAGTSVAAPAVNSDNVDNTTVFPPTVSATTGFGTVPAGSEAQTQTATTDPTTVNVRLPAAVAAPATCSVNRPTRRELLVTSPSNYTEFSQSTTTTTTINTPIPLIANSAAYGTGTGTGGAFVVDAGWGWSNGNPTANSTQTTMTLVVNGTDYARLTTTTDASTAGTLAALNGASISQTTVTGSAPGTAGNSYVARYVTLPAAVTSISTAVWRFNSPTSPGGNADDIGVQAVHIYGCGVPPTTANVTNATLVDVAGASTLNPNLSAVDADGTIASYTIVTLPAAASGVLALNGTAVTAGQTFTAAQLGTLTFDPVAGFSGNASFTYRATDNVGEVSNTSTYTIPVNRPPTTANVTNAVLVNTLAATGLTPNLSATDPDGTIASYTIATLPVAASGVLSVNGAAVTAGQTFTAAQLNTLSFDPAAGFSGNASFTYLATDNQGAVSNTSTYTIPVNNPPTTANVTNAVLLNTAPATVLNPNLSAADTDGTIASYTIVTLPSAASGVLALNGTAVTAGQTFTAAQLGTLTFNPAAGFSGNATFNYTATDNQSATSNTSAYTIPVNNPPTTANVTNAVLLDTAAATVLNPNLSATDTDGTIASYTIVTLPTAASGVLSVNGVAVTAGQTFTAAQLGTLTFDPVVGFNGNASFTYAATDNQGGASNTSTYTIPVNVAPVAVNDTGSTPANTAKTLSITGNDTDTAPGTINVTTTLFATSGQPTGSTLSNGNRTIAVPNEGTYTLDNSGNVTFTPVSGYSGTTTAVKYTVQDNQGATSNVASITVTVTPVATNDAASTAPSALVNLPVLNNDLGTGKVVTSVVFPTTGQPTGSTVTNGGKTLTNTDGVYTVKTDGTVDFTPALGKTGTLTPVLYTFKDAAGQTSNAATITVTVSAIAPPTATNDSKTTPKNTAVTLEGSTNDTPGSLSIDNASVVLTTGGTITNAGKTLTNAQGTYQVQANGTVLFTPVSTFAGTTTLVSYTVKDTSGATSNAATLTVTVTNQPPVANTVTNTLVVSTAAAAALNPGVSGTDADGTVVTYTVTTLPTAAMGTLYCNGTAIASVPSTCAPAQLSFKPNPAFDGNATFQYTVTDDNGATSNVATYTIPVNKPPVATNDSGATNPNVNVTFSVTGNDTDTAPGTVDVTSTAFDPSSTGTISNGGKTLTVTNQGVFTLDNAGNVTFAPAAGFNNGTSTARYTVKDNQGATSNVATITVNVPASVDLAITKSGPAYFKPGDTLSYTLTVTNGGSSATGVTVTDTLPAGLTFTSASAGGTYNAGTGKASWTLGTVAGGSTTTLTLTGTAPLAASVETNSGPTSLANTATTQGNETEVVTANNSSTTTAQLVYPKLSKRVRNVTQTGAFGTVGTGKPNEVLEYCIDFKNYGVAVASFVVSDTVPSNTTANLSGYGVGLGLQVVRGGVTTTRTSIGTDADGGSLSSAALSLDLGTLAAGESGSVCFQASIR